MPARVSDQRLASLLALAGVLLISLDSLWIRLSEAGGWDVAFWVGLFTFITLSLVLWISTKTSIVAVARRDGYPLLVSATLNTFSLTLFILSVEITTVANTVAIVAAAPVAAAVAARVFIGERASRRTWQAIVGSVVGILVIVSGSLGAGSMSGDLLAVLAVAAFACNLTLWRRYPDISRLAVIGLGGLFTAVVTFVPADPFAIDDGHALLILAIMGALTGPAGRVALATSTRHLPAARVGLFTPVETVAASTWAWVFVSEAPPTVTLIGGLIVIVAVAYGSYPRSKSRLSPERA